MASHRETAGTAQKVELLFPEPGDIDEGLRSAKHREQTQQQHLIERISTLPGCRGSGKSLKYSRKTMVS